MPRTSADKESKLDGDTLSANRACCRLAVSSRILSNGRMTVRLTADDCEQRGLKKLGRFGL